MPRIYKGTETILKLYVHQCEVGDINTLRIALFTDTVDNSVEFYSDNMTIDGDTVFLKVNAWSFDMMNDGVINYIAHIESGEETFITERQSNYFLKTPTVYEPTITPNMDNYYTKGEVNELLENIEVDVDLDDYATVESLNTLAAKVTTVEGNVDVWDDEILETKQHLKTLEDEWKYAQIGVRSGDETYDEYLKNHPEINFATINGESILGTKDILIQGGSGGGLVGDGTESPSFSSLNISRESIFGSGMGDADVSFYVSASIKSPKASIRDVWVENIHLGQEVSGPIGVLKFVAPFYGGNALGERDDTVYAMIDSEGNIYEGQTKLSDKYALKSEIGGGSTESYDDCLVLQYVGDYTVDFDGTSVEYNYAGSERQQHNIEVIQKVLSGEAKSVYYQYLHEQVYRNDEDGYNNKPTWLMMPMVYRYPSHDGIARFMGVINKDEWGGKHKLYAVGILMNESDASIYQYNESWINLNSGEGSVDLSDYYTKGEVDDIIGDINNILESI